MRILGIILDINKPLYLSLQKFFGIGKKRALTILRLLCIDANNTFFQLSFVDKQKLKQYLEDKKKTLGYNLLLAIKNNKINEIELRTYKGYRFYHNMPVRGQRTHSNSQTTRRLKTFNDKKNISSKKNKKFKSN